MARIKNIDLPNEKHTCIGLTAIYGIGRPLAKTICKNANVDETKKIKDLTEDEITALRKEVDKYVVEGDFSYDSGIEAVNRLNELKEKPTAVLVGADEMAVGVVNAVQDNGFKVPDDLEVISFDNTKLTLMVRPQVTTVVQPLYDIGAVAMRLLTKLMNKEEVQERAVVLPHRIEERHSTK